MGSLCLLALLGAASCLYVAKYHQPEYWRMGWLFWLTNAVACVNAVITWVVVYNAAAALWEVVNHG